MTVSELPPPEPVGGVVLVGAGAGVFFVLVGVFVGRLVAVLVGRAVAAGFTVGVGVARLGEEPGVPEDVGGSGSAASSSSRIESVVAPGDGVPRGAVEAGRALPSSDEDRATAMPV
ncbi:hypothetical protein [Actinoplanes sp. M2I2]|uniref:hypothetical protein n=1 Tax=Actinoplanes sp. M2I2 TaxID=1734444 RepID=UPI00202235E5|nr:hypothetical protein [Actinoplanes sp. M2I2]